MNASFIRDLSRMLSAHARLLACCAAFVALRLRHVFIIGYGPVISQSVT
jgi:hypothetical protein